MDETPTIGSLETDPIILVCWQLTRAEELKIAAEIAMQRFNKEIFDRSLGAASECYLAAAFILGTDDREDVDAVVRATQMPEPVLVQP